MGISLAVASGQCLTVGEAPTNRQSLIPGPRLPKVATMRVALGRSSEVVQRCPPFTPPEVTGNLDVRYSQATHAPPFPLSVQPGAGRAHARRPAGLGGERQLVPELRGR